MKLRRRQGHTLLELMAAAAIFSAMISLCGSLFVTHLRMSAEVTTRIDRMRSAQELQDTFTAAVRGAESLQEEWGGYQSSDSLLVLRLPARAGAQRHLLFGRIGEEQAVVRMVVLEAGNVQQMEYLEHLSVPVDAMRFVYAPSTRTIEMHYTLRNAGVPPIEHVSSAAMRAVGEDTP